MHRYDHVRRWTGFLAVVLLAAAGCSDGGTEPEAEPVGAIAGTVTDVDQNGIPDVTVEIVTGGSGTATTDAAGVFRFDSLAVGSYELAVQVPQGFELADQETGRKTVQVSEDQTATVDWTLAGSVEDDVVEIHLTSSRTFSPDSVEISTGTTVRWINDADIFHTITPRDANQNGVWSRQTTSNQGETFEHTFTVAGEIYDYFCEPHESQGMTGKIVVLQ